MKTLFLAGAALAALLAAPAVAQPAPPPTGAPMPGGGMDAMIERAFARIDTNHDGVVTRAEFEAFRAARKAEMDARDKERRDRDFTRMDANRDGSVSRGEFDAAPPPPPPPPPGAGMAPPGGDMAPPPAGAPLGYDPPGAPAAGPDARMMPRPHPHARPHWAPPGRPGMGRGMMAGPIGERWFDRADANHDGKVTLAEAKAAARAMMDRRGPPDGPDGPGGDMPPPRRP